MARITCLASIMFVISCLTLSKTDETGGETCQPQLLRPTLSMADSYSETCNKEPPICTVVDEGTMEMSFCWDACGMGPWAQCRFDKVDMTNFDRDHLSQGLLEVRFYTDAILRTDLNIYYGLHPKRKYVRLLTDEQKNEGMQRGWHRRLYTPNDALCPVYTKSDDEQVLKMPKECRNGCKDGHWEAKGRDCKFDYNDVALYVTAEWCISEMDTTISHLQVRYYPSQCICEEDSDCNDPSRPICDTSVTAVNERCSLGGPCAGVCVEE